MGTYGSRSVNVLSEDDALGLNDEEVDELVDITNHSIESLAGNSVVSAGSDLGSKTVVEDNLANNLGGNGNTQDHPGELECITDDIEISSREDQSNNGTVGNARSTCLVLSVVIARQDGQMEFTHGDSSMKGAQRRRSGSE